jgi:hypothetical protein
MDFTWIVVGLAGWALALVFVLLLIRMAGRQERAVRRREKRPEPFFDQTITKSDKSAFTTAYGGGSFEDGAGTDGSRPSAGDGTTETPQDVRRRL